MSNLTQSQLKALRKRWDKLGERISNNSLIDSNESSSDKHKRIDRARKDYNFFVTYYFPHYTKNKLGEVTPCADFHVKAANHALKHKQKRNIIEWGRGLAKSTHFDIFIPMWLKIQEPREINTMLLIGKNNQAAIRLLLDVQAEFQYNERYINDFGKQISAGNWSEGDFVTTDNVAFIALGMGQPVRGARNGANRPDYVVCDDLDDRKVCKNPARVREAVEWIYRDVIPAMDIGIARFFLVNNRIHKESILATIAQERKQWHHHKINALKKNGEPSWYPRYTKEFYDELQEDIGWKAFETEYQNNPTEDAGRFKLEHIQWCHPKRLSAYDRLVVYLDPSFRSGKSSDHKGGTFLGKLAREYHVLKCFNRQCEMSELVKWCYDLWEEIPSGVYVDWWIEGYGIQTDFLEDFAIEGDARGYQLPIMADMEQKGNKEDRIENEIKYFERLWVFFSHKIKGKKDTEKAIDHLTAWDRGSDTPDDWPDSFQGARKECDKSSQQPDRANKPIITKRRYKNAY